MKYFLTFFKITFFLIVFGSVAGTLTVMGVFLYYSRNLPDIITVEDYKPPVVTKIYSNDESTIIGEFYKEKRFIVSYEQIPNIVVQAFVSAEDDRFFEHQGINFHGILRAALANFRAGRIVQGGSSITQQIAKSLLLSPEKSYLRKIKEAILAGRIEKNLSKKQILYLYLNQIYLGHGAYGVEAASRVYFRKSVSQITLAEAAILAGLPQAPSKYSPIVHPEMAKDRQLYVLRRMQEQGEITEGEMQEAAKQILKIYYNENINLKYAPYYVEHVRRYLAEKYGDDALYTSGMSIISPLDVDLSLTAREALKEGLRGVEKRHGYRGPLEHFATTDEMVKFLKDYRNMLIKKKYKFRLLHPKDVDIDIPSYVGLRDDIKLVEKDDFIKAVVTAVDNKEKEARVLVGTLKGVIPIEEMKWAKLNRTGQPLKNNPGIKLPSEALRKGDLVLARIKQIRKARKDEKKKKIDNDNPSDRWELVLSLEQEPINQAALLSFDVKTGYLKAMVGGYDFEKSEFNRAIQALRQPGSALKPIIYSAALAKGYTPASIIVDSPIVYGDTEEEKWKPRNFSERFYGDTTLRYALIKSRNIPTIKMVREIGVPYTVRYARHVGVFSHINADLSIALGTSSVYLYELVKIYGMFPTGGKFFKPIVINRIMSREGDVLEENVDSVAYLRNKVLEGKAEDDSEQPNMNAVEQNANAAITPEEQAELAKEENDNNEEDEKKVGERGRDDEPSFEFDDPDRVIDSRDAYIMTHLMRQVVLHGTGVRARNIGRPAAGKTGTSNDYADAWFLGFTPFVLTGVWVGNDERRTLGRLETGARAALPIWNAFMKKAIENTPDTDFPIPPGIVFARIDPLSGKLTSSNDPKAIKEAFVEGTEPKMTKEESTNTVNSIIKDDWE